MAAIIGDFAGPGFRILERQKQFTVLVTGTAIVVDAKQTLEHKGVPFDDEDVRMTTAYARLSAANLRFYRTSKWPKIDGVSILRPRTMPTSTRRTLRTTRRYDDLGA